MLILRGVMDEAWLAAAHDAIDYITGAQPRGDEAPVFTDPEAWQAKGRFFSGVPNPIYGEGRRLFDPREWTDGPPPGGLLGLPHPLCDPFRRMLDCPALVVTLNKLIGAGWAIPHGARLGIRTTRRGDVGLFLHAGSDPVGLTNQQTTFGDGRTHTEYINVTWQLRDVNCDGTYANPLCPILPLALNFSYMCWPEQVSATVDSIASQVLSMRPKCPRGARDGRARRTCSKTRTRCGSQGTWSSLRCVRATCSSSWDPG